MYTGGGEPDMGRRHTGMLRLGQHAIMCGHLSSQLILTVSVMFSISLPIYQRDCLNYYKINASTGVGVYAKLMN